MSEANCRHCLYFDNPLKQSKGDCLRYPPQVVPNFMSGEVNARPSVTPLNWCGEFKSVTQAVDEALEDEKRRRTE